MARLTGVLGIVAILLFAYLFSTDRKAIRYRTVFIGLALQFVFAVLVLRVSFGERVMTIAGDAVNRLLSHVGQHCGDFAAGVSANGADMSGNPDGLTRRLPQSGPMFGIQRLHC